MSEQDGKPTLRPAKLGLDEQRAYLPRVPWLWLTVGVAVAGALVIGFRRNQNHKASELRGQMRQVHEDSLATPAASILGFRDRLTKLVRAAADEELRPVVDPRLRLSGLRTGQGLYLRVRASNAHRDDKLEAEALSMTPDAVTRCLGITAASARTLYEKAPFLEPEWLQERIEEDRTVMQLRVADEVLAQHIKADLPSLLGLLKSQWFLLLVQQGDNRHTEPVDVHLWDLRRDTLLLRGRIQARGALLPTRIISQGKPAGRARRAWDGSGAQDCSLAAQIRALAGADTAEVRSTLPTSGVSPAPTAAPEAAAAVPNSPVLSTP